MRKGKIDKRRGCDARAQKKEIAICASKRNKKTGWGRWGVVLPKKGKELSAGEILKKKKKKGKTRFGAPKTRNPVTTREEKDTGRGKGKEKEEKRSHHLGPREKEKKSPSASP